MDFIYLFRVLMKRKWLIIGAAFLATLIAYLFTRNEEKKYRSVAQVSTGFTISDEIKVGNENFSFYEADTKFNNAIVTCTSPSVISLLSYKLILHDLEDPKPFNWLTPEKKNSALYLEIDKPKAIQTYRHKLETMSSLTSFDPEEKRLLELLKLYGYDYKVLYNNLNVFRLQRTDYIQIEYISSNPELSAFIVNTIFQQFIRYYKNVRSDKSQESIDTLQSLLEKKKQTLDEKGKLLQSEGVGQVGLENSSKLELIMNLETTLTEEKSKQTNMTYERQKLDQRLAALNKGSASSANNTAAQQGNGNKDNDDLLALRKQRDDAYAAYANSGSEDPALLKKYNTLKAEYQSKVLNSSPETTGTPETGTTTIAPTLSRTELLTKKSDLEVDIQASNANIASIQEKINSVKGNLALDASKEAAVQALLNELQLANKEYLDAKQKYNDAMDINSASVTNFRQILHGQPAIEPEPSKRMLITGMAGVSVFIIGILTIVLLAYLDSSIKTPEIFARIVNLKLIGMVNFMNLKQKSLADLVANKDHSIDIHDRNKLNVFRESLRKLRYEIEMSGKKVFLFTSTKKGEGKTTLIQALAFSMSMSKKRILIIDTNFCNPDLTMALNADPILEKIHPNGNGANGSRPLLDQVREAAKDVGMGTVYAIGSQGGDYTPSEILPRENLLKHLQTLTADYDFIFLEGPPLNDFSDSKELAQFADGIIAIFSATNIIKQIDKESMNFFRDLNGKFTGAILNKVDLQNVNVS
jgi:succinoglycan biosynthesis transport protein ExoP